ncbi:MAG TPA: protein-disulfide reductase DsbD [Candidatus Thioglobus sp.]|jgi:thiol:disulfide interchange protein DsbD|nr:protein-disulfide reductase DsbD [Candidatus Thioglobus sp.]
MKRLLSFFLLLLLGPFSQANASLLPANEAFQLNAQIVEDKVELTWSIASGYFVVKESIEISTAESNQLGASIFPQAIPTVDAFLGNINIYRGEQSVVLPISSENTSDLALSVVFDGCADLGICYPPITKNITLSTPIKTQVQVVSEAPALDSSATAEPSTQVSLLQAGGPLPADEAFNLDVIAIDEKTLNVRWLVHKDYYLYKDKISISVEGASIANIAYPDATLKNDEFFGQVSIYDRPIEVLLSLANISSGKVTLSIEYQGCWKGGVCYPPQQANYSISLPGSERNNVAVDPESDIEAPTNSLPAAFEQMNNEELTAQELFQKGGLALFIGAFLAGLALSYTPCIYPMVPILSGIIVGQKDSPSTLKAVLMSLAFVLSMSIAYGLIGATAGYFGAGVNIQAILQTPWVLVLFGLIFIFLAFSMFGYYDIQLPKKLQSKITQISNKQNGGSFIGVAIMGFLSALIIGPCVTPFLATALSYVIADGSATKGAIGLFAMGLGMGVPLIIICGWGINALPKSGLWMETVKHVFGVLMLAVALYLLDRIISPFASLALWASLLTIAPIALGAITPLDKQSSSWRRIFKAVNLIVLGYGILLWLLVARGGGDMHQPLADWDYNANNQTVQSIDFELLQSEEQLDRLIANTQGSDNLIVLKFYADWCVSCKTLERKVFSDREVIKNLDNALALTANVTDNTEANKSLLARFDIAGPPAILFFKNGKEARSQRIIGEISAKDFLKRLKSI